MKALLVFLGVAALALPSVAATTFERIVAEGELRCLTSRTGAAAFERGEDGEPDLFYIDICRAIAAGALGDPSALRFLWRDDVPKMLGALAAGETDVIVRNMTRTPGREAQGFSFPAIYLYDGQGFVAPVYEDRVELEDFAGARVCVWSGTTTEGNLIDVSKRLGLDFIVKPTWSEQSHIRELLAGECDVATDDLMALRGAMIRGALDGRSFRLLPAIISREPVGPVVRADDRAWSRFVGWVVHALVIAEENAYTQADAIAGAPGTTAEMARLLGDDGDLAATIGPDARWARRAIAAAGHYGELYDRRLGRKAKQPLARRYNALWRDGGLLYAPPFR